MINIFSQLRDVLSFKEYVDLDQGEISALGLS